MLRSLLTDFNSYFASVEQQEDPQLRGKPVAVVPLLADTTCCIAASYEAKAFGVKTGTIVKEARRLCPQLIVREARHEIYVRYHEHALDLIDEVIPIRRVLSIDEVECELTGSWRKLETALSIAQRIKRRLHDGLGECMRTSIGIAPNTLLAKLASNMQKPDGLVVLNDADIPSAFLHLRPSDINGIGPQMGKRLDVAGINTMAALYAAPREALRALWGGIAGAQMFDLLRGQWQEMARPMTRSISHSHVLPPAERTAQGARAVLNRLMQKAAMRLRKMDYYATAMTVSVSVRAPLAQKNRSTRWQRKVRLGESRDTAVLLNALETLCAVDMPTAPWAVGISLHGLTPATEHSLSLFDDVLPEGNNGAAAATRAHKRENLLRTVDNINKAYGKNTVYFASAKSALQAAPMRIAFNHIPDIETER